MAVYGAKNPVLSSPGPGIDEPVCMIIPAGRPNAGTYFYYFDGQDHLFSPVVLFDDDGAVAERYEYDAYGACRVLDADLTADADGRSDYGNPVAFTGRTLDTLDNGNLPIMYYRARTYDPQTGRFMQRDPLGIDPAGGFSKIYDPTTQYSNASNLYCYVVSNPINWLDAFGEAISQSLCELGVNDAKNSPEGAKLLKDLKKKRELTKGGRQKPCTIPKFMCRCCSHGGGYFRSYNYRIHICINALNSRSDAQRVVIHELMHAWDHCKGNLSDCEELACSEIRAYRFSGQCRREGGWRQPGEGLIDCVKRSATSSLSAIPDCAETAASDVNAVFSECWNKEIKPFF